MMAASAYSLATLSHIVLCFVHDRAQHVVDAAPAVYARAIHRIVRRACRKRQRQRGTDPCSSARVAYLIGAGFAAGEWDASNEAAAYRYTTLSEWLDDRRRRGVCPFAPPSRVGRLIRRARDAAFLWRTVINTPSDYLHVAWLITAMGVVSSTVAADALLTRGTATSMAAIHASHSVVGNLRARLAAMCGLQT